MGLAVLRALILVLAFWALRFAFAQAPAKAVLHLVFVIDGLRPDSITANQTPILSRLGNEGVIFENSHSVFPTVTRVNSASLSTGMQPARHGIMGNQIYIPAVDPVNAFSNDNFLPLLKLGELSDGRIVLTPSIAELTAEIGHRYVAVSSGSTGSALLMAPRAPRGSGAVINGNFYGGSAVGWPETVSNEVLRRFGPQPKLGGARDNFNAAVDWSMTVLREYALPELKPSVAYIWVTEPDHIQHAFGAGAPQSLPSIRNDDRHLGLVLEGLDKLGLRERTNIMVVSDHGFSQTVYGVPWRARHRFRNACQWRDRVPRYCRRQSWRHEPMDSEEHHDCMGAGLQARRTRANTERECRCDSYDSALVGPSKGQCTRWPCAQRGAREWPRRRASGNRDAHAAYHERRL